MIKIEKITNFLHSFTTPVFLVVLGVIGSCFGLLENIINGLSKILNFLKCE